MKVYKKIKFKVTSVSFFNSVTKIQRTYKGKIFLVVYNLMKILAISILGLRFAVI